MMNRALGHRALLPGQDAEADRTAAVNWHIACLIVRCLPQHEAAVVARLRALELTDVRGAEQGRIIVIAEGANEYELAQRFDAIRATPDVMTTDLVHHEIDSDNSEDAHAQHAP